MSELSRDAAALIRSGRTAFRPNASDRDRVLNSLNAILPESVAVDRASHARRADGASASRFVLKSWLVGGLAAIALGTGGAIVTPHLWTRAPSRAEPTLQIPVAPAAETTATARLSEAREATQNLATASPSSRDIASASERPRAERVSSSLRSASRSAARQVPDFLPEEVRLLSRAEQQINDGLATDALKTLGEHERRFPTGALAEERMAARVQAMCALGRTAEAQSDLTMLTRAYPQSSYLERARRVCGIDVGSAP
jgi:hypothetical protein